MVREGAVEYAMPMGNVAKADLTENIATSKQQKPIQYPIKAIVLPNLGLSSMNSIGSAHADYPGASPLCARGHSR